MPPKAAAKPPPRRGSTSVISPVDSPTPPRSKAASRPKASPGLEGSRQSRVRLDEAAVAKAKPKASAKRVHISVQANEDESGLTDSSSGSVASSNASRNPPPRGIKAVGAGGSSDKPVTGPGLRPQIAPDLVVPDRIGKRRPSFFSGSESGDSQGGLSSVEDSSEVSPTNASSFPSPTRELPMSPTIEEEGSTVASSADAAVLRTSAANFVASEAPRSRQVVVDECPASTSSGAGESTLSTAVSGSARGESKIDKTMASLKVSILEASNLKHLNFTGDAPWVACEVRRSDSKDIPLSCKTEALKNTLDPVWNEIHTLDSWIVGEALDFTVYDQGLIGSKREGNATLSSDRFYPNGFRASIPIDGVPTATLRIAVEVIEAGRLKLGIFGASDLEASRADSDGEGGDDGESCASSRSAPSLFSPGASAESGQAPKKPSIPAVVVSSPATIEAVMSKRSENHAESRGQQVIVSQSLDGVYMQKLIEQLEEQQLKLHAGLIEALAGEEQTREDERRWCNALSLELAKEQRRRTDETHEMERRHKDESQRQAASVREQVLVLEERVKAMCNALADEEVRNAVSIENEVSGLKAETDAARRQAANAEQRAVKAEGALIDMKHKADQYETKHEVKSYLSTLFQRVDGYEEASSARAATQRDAERLAAENEELRRQASEDVAEKQHSRARDVEINTLHQQASKHLASFRVESETLRRQVAEATSMQAKAMVELGRVQRENEDLRQQVHFGASKSLPPTHRRRSIVEAANPVTRELLDERHPPMMAPAESDVEDLRSSCSTPPTAPGEMHDMYDTRLVARVRFVDTSMFEKREAAAIRLANYAQSCSPTPTSPFEVSDADGLRSPPRGTTAFAQGRRALPISRSLPHVQAATAPLLVRPPALDARPCRGRDSNGIVLFPPPLARSRSHVDSPPRRQGDVSPRVAQAAFMPGMFRSRATSSSAALSPTRHASATAHCLFRSPAAAVAFSPRGGHGAPCQGLEVSTSVAVPLTLCVGDPRPRSGSPAAPDTPPRQNLPNGPHNYITTRTPWLPLTPRSLGGGGLVPPRILSVTPPSAIRTNSAGSPSSAFTSARRRFHSPQTTGQVLRQSSQPPSYASQQLEAEHALIPRQLSAPRLASPPRSSGACPTPLSGRLQSSSSSASFFMQALPAPRRVPLSFSLSTLRGSGELEIFGASVLLPSPEEREREAPPKLGNVVRRVTPQALREYREQHARESEQHVWAASDHFAEALPAYVGQGPSSGRHPRPDRIVADTLVPHPPALLIGQQAPPTPPAMWGGEGWAASGDNYANASAGSMARRRRLAAT